MKASRVQQLEPIRAINVEKLGMTTTIRPLRMTMPVLSTLWEKKVGWVGGGERVNLAIHKQD